jgi:hypothetical protein
MPRAGRASCFITKSILARYILRAIGKTSILGLLATEKSQKISHFTGIELDEEYLEVAEQRLNPPMDSDSLG